MTTPTAAIAIAHPSAAEHRSTIPTRRRTSAPPTAGRRQPPPPAAKKAAARKPKARKGRASVPSWDEILFGATRTDD